MIAAGCAGHLLARWSTSGIASLLVCELSGELRPFDTCRALALVKNRFRLD